MSGFGNNSAAATAINVLKKFDYFRVVLDTDRHLSPSTKRSNAISIVYAVAVALLMINEARMYFTPTIESSMIVNSHPFEMETLHFDITFAHFACEHLEFMALDPMSGRVFEEQQRTVQANKKYEPGNGCRVAGTMEIDKIPGNFMLAARNFPFGAQPVPATDFTVNDLWVGDIAKVKYVDEESAHAMKGFSARNVPPRTIFQFFLQVVPTLVHNDRGHHEETAYQYTVTQSSVMTDAIPPGLYFHHRHNPLSVELHVKWQTLSHFLVHLCAIIGGLYIVLGFIVRALEWAAARAQDAAAAAASS